MRNSSFGLAVAVILVGSAIVAEEHGKDFRLFPADKTEWRDGPPSLPRGAKIAVLEGDPNKDGPFVFRAKVPDGYRIPPHTHPKTERVTVIAGTFNMGMGDKFDEKAAKPMPAGTYGYWEAGMKHFVWIKGEEILSIVVDEGFCQAATSWDLTPSMN